MGARSKLVATLTAAGLAYAWWKARRPASSLDGLTAVVTGGSRGLGLLLAQELIRAGCRVAICARDAAELERARQALEIQGGEVLARVCDVRDRAQVEAFIGEVIAEFGGLDVLVNNASVIQVGPVEAMTLEDFEDAMATNHWGAVYATLAVLPHMRSRQRGRIVMIDSIGGRVAVPHLLPYSTAKFALRGFSEGLRAELASEGIAVTTVLPGLMRTGSPLHALFKGDRDLEYTWFALADNLGLTSMDAETAARRIIEATRRGEPELTLSWQAKTLGLIHDVFPGFTQAALSLADRLLPKSDGMTRPALAGKQLAPPLMPARVAARYDAEARKLNQYDMSAEPSPVYAGPTPP